MQYRSGYSKVSQFEMFPKIIMKNFAFYLYSFNNIEHDPLLAPSKAEVLQQGDREPASVLYGNGNKLPEEHHLEGKDVFP